MTLVTLAMANPSDMGGDGHRISPPFFFFSLFVFSFFLPELPWVGFFFACFFLFFSALAKHFARDTHDLIA